MRNITLKSGPLLVLFIGLLTTIPASAEIYTWKDADGNTVYSDHPAENSTEIKLPKMQTVPGRPVTTTPTQAPATPKKETDSESYRELAISEPADGQEQWANNGQVNVVVSIEPALMVNMGHYLSLSVDGTTQVDQSPSTQMTLTEVDRGSHQLSVSVHDRNGNTLKTSQTITVHIHRRSLLNK